MIPALAPSTRLFTQTIGGWAMHAPSHVPPGAFAVALMSNAQVALVRMGKDDSEVITTLQDETMQGSASAAALFALRAVVNAPVVDSSPPLSRAGRPARKKRRLLVFSPTRWQWEAVERTDANPGDVFRLVESSGKIVTYPEMPDTIFRWNGEVQEVVPCELDELGPRMIDDEIIRQGLAWLGVSDSRARTAAKPQAADDSTEAAAAPPARQPRRITVKPPPTPAGRAVLATIPEEEAAPPVAPPIVLLPELPPEPAALSADDPTGEHAMPMPTEAESPALPQEITLRDISPEALERVRARRNARKDIGALEEWMTARGWPPGTEHEAEADMEQHFKARSPVRHARRAPVGGRNLRLVQGDGAGEPNGASEPAAQLDDDGDYINRVVQDYDRGAGDEDTIPAAFPDEDEPSVDEDGCEPGLLDDYEDQSDAEAAASATMPAVISIGTVLPGIGRCVSMSAQQIVVVLTDEEREERVVELTQMPSLFADHEKQKADFMAAWKERKLALQKRERDLGDAITTFKEMRTVRVAGIYDGTLVVQVNADDPTHRLGTRRPEESDRLQMGMFNDEDGQE